MQPLLNQHLLSTRGESIREGGGRETSRLTLPHQKRGEFGNQAPKMGIAVDIPTSCRQVLLRVLLQVLCRKGEWKRRRDQRPMGLCLRICPNPIDWRDIAEAPASHGDILPPRLHPSQLASSCRYLPAYLSAPGPCPAAHQGRFSKFGLPLTRVEPPCRF